MNNTLLTVHDLNMKSDSFGELRHVSFRINRKEVLALLGLDGSGPELLQQVLSGNPDYFPARGTGLFLEDKKHPKQSELQRLTRRIPMAEETLEKWSVAEYLGLQHSGAFLWGPARKQMRKHAEEVFLQYGLEIDPDRTVGSLGELQRRIVRILRVLEEDAKILIVEDECIGMDRKEIREYGAFIRRVAEEGKAVLFRSQSVEAAGEICRDYLIFRRGRLVKYSTRGEAFKTQTAEIRQYLLGDTYASQIRKLDRPHGGLSAEQFRQQETEHGAQAGRRSVIYQVQGLVIDEKPWSLSFHEGEITCLETLNRELRKEMFDNLSGRKIGRYTEYRLSGQLLMRPDQLVFIRNRVVSADIGNGWKELFGNLSAEDNLLLPSLAKFSNMQYFQQNSNLKKTVSEEKLSEEDEAYRIGLSKAGMNERIRLLMERWYVYNPKVLILYEPFSYCDAVGVSLISSYIRRFAERGTAVIIIQPGQDYIQDLADRISHL